MTPQVWLNDDGPQPAGEPWIDARVFSRTLCSSCQREMTCDGSLIFGPPSAEGIDFQAANWRVIGGKPHCAKFESQ